MAIEIFQQRSDWESQGVPRPEGSRYWSAGEEPAAEHFNWFFYSVVKDIEDLAKYIQDQAGVRVLVPEMWTLAGDTPAQLGVVEESGVPVLLFGPNELVSALIAFRAFKPTEANHYVDIWWAPTGATNGESVVFTLRYAHFAEGNSLITTPLSSTQIVQAPQTAHALTKTSFAIGNLTQGNLVVLWLCRDGAHASDNLNMDIEVPLVEVR